MTSAAAAPIKTNVLVVVTSSRRYEAEGWATAKQAIIKYFKKVNNFFWHLNYEIWSGPHESWRKTEEIDVNI